MKKIITFLLLALFVEFCLPGQIPGVPVIGAQIFIEPGQTPGEIESYFKTLSENGMEIARIRLFGTHVRKDDGWDFSLYDKAFDLAGEYGVKLFITLFPPTGELTDVGGFKHPRGFSHLEEIGEYVKACVSRYASHPALYGWVLQNEPGTGGLSVRKNDLTEMVRRQWEKENPVPERGDGFLREDFTEFRFLRHFNTWYLSWLASKVRAFDSVHPLHVNPHQLFQTLPEYEFSKYEAFLGSLGVSMHQSWHFADFGREEYPIGVSMMADIIRERAGSNTFWVTELQGGNVTASGMVPFCPTAEEIKKYLWVNVFCGAEGVIFWTLNARKAAMEAGEWALIDYQGQPSDRFSAAVAVLKALKEDSFYRGEYSVEASPLTILYNDESLLIQRHNSELVHDTENPARGRSAVIKSVIEAYKAASSLGPTPSLESMEYFDWDPQHHPAVVLPNIISIPLRFHENLRTYVQSGGKLFVTGLSGYYDEGMGCLMMEHPQPFFLCFGASLSEFKASGRVFDVSCGGTTLPAHLWRGVLKPSTGEVIGITGEEVCAVHNCYGEGHVWWIPSPVHLGAAIAGNKDIVRVYSEIFRDEYRKAAVRFSKPVRGVLLRVIRKDNILRCCLVNLDGEKKTVTLVRDDGKHFKKSLLPDEVVLTDIPIRAIWAEGFP